MLRAKFRILTGLFILFFFLGLISCNKSNKIAEKDSKNTEPGETEEISKNDFTEKDEDLVNVDYKEFYDELAPYGEWIEVTEKDIDLDLKKTSAAGENSHRKISFSQFFGVKDAYADEAAFGAFFIWQPSPNLAVSVVAADPEPYYVPYSNGQWVYTDDGWYFMAPTPYEEVVHHYGRWMYSPALGWVWLPGRVWAPAWVEWRVGLGYTAWEPLPPSIYIVDNYIITPPVYEDRFIIVENRYFCEPGIYKYRYFYDGHGDKIMIKDMTRVNGVMVRDSRVFNEGPDITMIERDRGSKLEMVRVNKVKEKGNYKFDGKEIKSYSPDFKRLKRGADQKSSVTKPEKFDAFSHAKNSGGRNQEYVQKNNNNGGSTDKNSRGSDKNYNKNEGKYKNENNTGGKNKDYGQRKDNSRKNSDFGKQNDRNYKGNNKSGNDNKDMKNGKNEGRNYDKGGNKDRGGKDKGGNKKFNSNQDQKDYNGRNKSNDAGGKQKKFSRSYKGDTFNKNEGNNNSKTNGSTKKSGKRH